MKLNSILAAVIVTTTFSLPAAAHTVVYHTSLTGLSEAPPNASPATGTATVTVDYDLVTMRVVVNFTDLLGTVTAAHIHCCTTAEITGTAGVATTTPTFTDFPADVASGSYDKTFDMTLAASYNPAFITAQGGSISTAFNALAMGLDTNKAYFNIHTSVFPGGEARGFLAPQLIPVPAAGWLFGCGLAGLLGTMRRKSTTA